MNTIRTVISGASGRMGRTLIRMLSEEKDFTVTGALERKGSPDLGKDSGMLEGENLSGVDAYFTLSSSDGGRDGF